MQKRGLNKRGQIAIFIVIGLIIIVAVVALFFIRQRLAPQIPGPGVGPSQISLQFEDGIRECVRSSAQEAIDNLGVSGGVTHLSLEEFRNQGGTEDELRSVTRVTETEREEYFTTCHSEMDFSVDAGEDEELDINGDGDYFDSGEDNIIYGECVNQMPYGLAKKKYVEGIQENVKVEGGECVNQILDNAKENGFSVLTPLEPTVIVEIKTDRIEIRYIQEISITKGREKIDLEGVTVPMDSNIDLILEKQNDITNSYANGGMYTGDIPDWINNQLIVVKKGEKSDQTVIYNIQKDEDSISWSLRSHTQPSIL